MAEKVSRNVRLDACASSRRVASVARIPERRSCFEVVSISIMLMVIRFLLVGGNSDSGMAAQDSGAGECLKRIVIRRRKRPPRTRQERLVWGAEGVQYPAERRQLERCKQFTPLSFHGRSSPAAPRFAPQRRRHCAGRTRRTRSRRESAHAPGLSLI